MMNLHEGVVIAFNSATSCFAHECINHQQVVTPTTSAQNRYHGVVMEICLGDNERYQCSQ